MDLRPYQIEAVDSTLAAWEASQSVLGVAATGLGKTVVLASIIARHAGRTMVVAHREELIFQAARTIERVTGRQPDIEMAELRANEHGLHGKARVVISTIQTQGAGSRGGRMSRFDPGEFGLLVIDEAHHAVAGSYRKVITHYRQNENLRVLGVTATPDRTDEEALGQVFDSVAFEYDIRFGIDEGWLVPVYQSMVHVDGLDLSQVRTTAGDLNGADLARVMEYEKNLHEIAAPTIELTGDRKTLVFAASLAHAERLCEILNRHRPDSARWVSGKTPGDERRQMLKDYAGRRFQYLVNVGVATEGFDDPGIECVVMARPTKSRALYCQCVGRGTRPLPGVVDDPDMFGSAGMRRAAIADSSKAAVEIIDFVGNCGKHKLVSTADVLGGNYSDEVIEKAREIVERQPGQAQNMQQALGEAEKAIAAERERAAKAEAARRARVVASAKYSTQNVDPFDVFHLTPWRERAWEKDKPLTQKMVDMLERQGVTTEGLSWSKARQLISEITSRWDDGRCSFKQARLLAEHGHSTEVSRERASQIISEIVSSKRNGQLTKQVTRY